MIKRVEEFDTHHIYILNARGANGKLIKFGACFHHAIPVIADTYIITQLKIIMTPF